MPADAPIADSARNAASQPIDGRQRTAQAGQRIDRGGDDQRALAAEPVGQRALAELSDRQAGEPRGEGELCRAGRRVERRLDGGEGRQVHVRGRRPDRGEEAEQDGQPERGRSCAAGAGVGADPGGEVFVGQVAGGQPQHRHCRIDFLGFELQPFSARKTHSAANAVRLLPSTKG